MPDNDYAIETFSLTKIFSDFWGREKVYAVNDLNLKIRYNEIFGLLGPNGSGKTTTLKMLLGLLRPTRGKAIVLGGDSTDPKINSRIGFLPEESYLYNYLTARETLDFYGRLFSLPRQLRKARVEALLDMVGLKAVANRPVGTFSKGMARRIGLAQALINDPDLLILDEPTTGLDPIGTRQIKDLILQLAKRGKTILLCSHLLADVEDVCDRIAILYGGRVQAEGEVKQLLQQYDKTQITAEALPQETLEKIEEILASEKASFEISAPMERLETFFIRIVTEAQKEALPTSGAVSTTRIEDFLATTKGQEESILDRLVSASLEVSESQKTVETEKPKPVETVQPDTKLIEQLTEGAMEPQVEPKPEMPQQTQQPQQAEQVNEDLLEELTGQDKESHTNHQDEDKERGETGHA